MSVLPSRIARPLLAVAALSSAALAAPSFAQKPDVPATSPAPALAAPAPQRSDVHPTSPVAPQLGVPPTSPVPPHPGVPPTSPAPADANAPRLDTLTRAFPELVQSMQQTGAPTLTAVAPGGHVGRGRQGEFVWSSLPMTVGGEAVQRALRVDRTGVARPANPLVAAELPLSASSAFSVGEGAGGFSVVPVSAADGSHEVLGDGLLHEATHTDTSTLVRAVTGGVETYELLGSSEAPERFRYRIDGATPRPGDRVGVLDLVSGGRVVGTVSAPVVVDATGRDVPATLTADGDHVEFTVAHRAADFAYPVLADPLWATNYNFANPAEGVEGLSFDYEPTTENHYDIAAENASGPSPWTGITIRPLGGRTYQPGDIGRATFAAPPGATITSADFRGVYRRNDSDRQTIRLALYGAGPAVVNDFSTTLDPQYDASIPLSDPTASAKFAQVWMSTPTCQLGEADCPRYVEPTNASRVTVQQVVITLNDPGAPTTTLGGSVATLGPEWRQGTGDHTLDLAASDNGSGIASWKILQRQSATEDVLAGETVACDPRHTTPGQDALVCPEIDGSSGIPIKLDLLREGRIQLVGQANDFAGNAQDGSSSALGLRLDRSAPVLAPLAGSLLAGGANRWQQLRGSGQIAVKASDTYSGVKAADVTVAWAGGSDQQTVDLCQPAGSVDQPCPTEYEGQLAVNADDLPDGALEVTAKARDYVGYESVPQSTKLFKDNTDPAATARGELTDLEGEWTNSTETTGVRLDGKDRRSGVARLELYATDANGRRLIEDVAVCDTATIDASRPDGHCPKQVSRPTSVDLGAFETGEVTLEAYATDAAGNRNATPDSWETYLDYDPPTSVSRINAIALNATTTRVSWLPASDEGSGVDGYEYRLWTADGRFTEWNTTPFSGAQIPTELETGWIEIRAKDKTGNRGPSLNGRVLGYRAGLGLRAGLGFRAGIGDLVGRVIELRRGLNQELWPVIGGFVCGEAGICKRLAGRDTPNWLIGEILSGFIVVGDLRDVALALLKADAGAGALAAAGLVPLVGDSAKATAAIRKFMKRTKMPLHEVMGAVAKVTGKDSALTRVILDRLTAGGYGRLRRFDVSHEGAEQLVRSGNDIGALTRRANLARRPLSAAEKRKVETQIKQHWGSVRGADRSEALGIECSISYLQRDPNVEILLSGRPNPKLRRAGPDIVAYNGRTNRLIVVEAKGTMRRDHPLSLDKLETDLGNVKHVQPSIHWLKAPRKAPHDYLEKLEESKNADHRTAARLIREFNSGKRRKIDLKIVQVRPATAGTQAYGPGLDTASRHLKDSRVASLDIIDVPY